MLYIGFILLSVWFNHIWIVNNEIFILAIFFLIFFFLIYIFLGFTIKMYFFFFSSNLLNLFRYLDTLNISLDKVMYYNLVIKKKFLETLISKNKKKSVILFGTVSSGVNSFFFFCILNIFLILRRNLFKIKKNRNLFFFCNKVGTCKIAL